MSHERPGNGDMQQVHARKNNSNWFAKWLETENEIPISDWAMPSLSLFSSLLWMGGCMWCSSFCRQQPNMPTAIVLLLLLYVSHIVYFLISFDRDACNSAIRKKRKEKTTHDDDNGCTQMVFQSLPLSLSHVCNVHMIASIDLLWCMVPIFTILMALQTVCIPMVQKARVKQS